jgi:predicted transcriptional regulator
MSRAKLPENEAASRWLTVRITPEMDDALRQLAEVKGHTKGWVAKAGLELAIPLMKGDAE